MITTEDAKRIALECGVRYIGDSSHCVGLYDITNDKVIDLNEFNNADIDRPSEGFSYNGNIIRKTTYECALWPFSSEQDLRDNFADLAQYQQLGISIHKVYPTPTGYILSYAHLVKMSDFFPEPYLIINGANETSSQ